MAIQIQSDFRRVIVAASVGNVIEWYDFYIFGSLAAVLSVKFFEQSHAVAALAEYDCAVHRRIPDPSTGGLSFSDGWATGSAASIRSLLRLAKWDWARGRSG
jgi:hypothetical protein